MISYIKWTIIELESNYTTILTSGGVWYDILINELTFSKLINNSNTELFIYHYKTENSESLFWFLDKAEKIFFQEIIKISWIWWKVALSILSIWLNSLYQAINNEDLNKISSIKWIWKKMSEKFILEMKDKKFDINFNNNTENNKPHLDKNLFESIKNTLTNMWYKPKDIDEVLLNLPKDLEQDIKTILPFVIKKLS